MSTNISRRDIFGYRCSKCGKQARSLIARRAFDGYCKFCRKHQADPNQLSIFPNNEK